MTTLAAIRLRVGVGGRGGWTLASKPLPHTSDHVSKLYTATYTSLCPASLAHAQLGRRRLPASEDAAAAAGKELGPSQGVSFVVAAAAAEPLYFKDVSAATVAVASAARDSSPGKGSNNSSSKNNLSEFLDTPPAPPPPGSVHSLKTLISVVTPQTSSSRLHPPHALLTNSYPVLGESYANVRTLENEVLELQAELVALQDGITRSEDDLLREKRDAPRHTGRISTLLSMPSAPGATWRGAVGGGALSDDTTASRTPPLDRGAQLREILAVCTRVMEELEGECALSPSARNVLSRWNALEVTAARDLAEAQRYHNAEFREAELLEGRFKELHANYDACSAAEKTYNTYSASAAASLSEKARALIPYVFGPPAVHTVGLQSLREIKDNRLSAETRKSEANSLRACQEWAGEAYLVEYRREVKAVRERIEALTARMHAACNALPSELPVEAALRALREKTALATEGSVLAALRNCPSLSPSQDSAGVGARNGWWGQSEEITAATTTTTTTAIPRGDLKKSDERERVLDSKLDGDSTSQALLGYMSTTTTTTANATTSEVPWMEAKVKLAGVRAAATAAAARLELNRRVLRSTRLETAVDEERVSGLNALSTLRERLARQREELASEYSAKCEEASQLLKQSLEKELAPVRSAATEKLNASQAYLGQLRAQVTVMEGELCGLLDGNGALLGLGRAGVEHKSLANEIVAGLEEVISLSSEKESTKFNLGFLDHFLPVAMMDLVVATPNLLAEFQEHASAWETRGVSSARAQ